MTAFCNHFIRVDLCDVCSPIKDPRDAEIASLKAEVERFKRALAAGPAALRAMAADYDRKVQMYGVKGVAVTPAILRSADLINAALHVEAAQDAAMKEKP